MKGDKQFMKKRTKKILALLLAIVMAISLMPLAALAEGTGNTTEDTAKTGEVATVVYGPTFTKLLRSGTTLKIEEILTELANAAMKAKETGSVIPEVDIVLINEETGKEYPMTKNPDISFADSLGASVQTGSSLIDYLANGVLNQFLSGDSMNTIVKSGRGYAFETYSTGQIPEGVYKAYIKEIKGEGYAIKDEASRTVENIEVKGDQEKPVYIGEANSSFSQSQKIGWFSASFELDFSGYWITKKPIGFQFSNKDVVGAGINGNEFTLVNRDQVLDILTFMKDLGKETFETVLANLQNEDVFDFNTVVELHKHLINTESGSVSLDYTVARELVNTYLALLSGIDVWNEVLHSGLVLPAIHTATSATVDGVDGIVEFNEDTNVTLTWAFDQMLKLIDLLPEDNQAVQLFNKVIEILEPLKDKINDEGYDLIYYGSGILGENVPQILSEKMPSGNYLMFQTEVENKDFQRSPLAYTMNITWENADWLYVTVADLGIIGPYVAKGFYEYVRNTTFEGPVAKAFKAMALGYEFGSDATLYNLEILDNINDTLMTGSLKLDDENSVKLLGAYSAYIADTMYRGLGLNVLYNSRKALMEGMNAYLLDNAKASRGLMGYVNEQAKKAKSVYTDKVDLNWTFYNLDTSPTTTATKLIQKSTDDITKIMNDSTSYRAIGEDGQPAANSPRGELVAKTGAQVKSIVSKIGTRIEETNKAIATRIKESATKILGGFVEKAKTSVESIAKNLFSSIFGNLFGGNNTANA